MPYAAAEGHDFATLAGKAALDVSTEFRVAHDSTHLAINVRCEEPEMDRVWSRRSDRTGRLDLDDCVEILLDPYSSGGFCWTFRVTPAGEWETVIPVGAVVRPDCRVRVQKTGDGWEAFLRVPFVDVGLEGDLRGTPVNGETWGMAVVRRRREGASGRQVAAWAGDVSSDVGPGALAKIRFWGGPATRPVDFTKYAAGGFGINEICVAFEGGAVPPDVEVDLIPAPAKRLRSKDASRLKFPTATPGLSRHRLKMPYHPMPDPTEEEIAAIEGEAGRELTEQELAEHFDKRPGTPAYVAGLSFLLPDIWPEVERMEGETAELRSRLEEAGLGVSADMRKLLDNCEAALDHVDSHRGPHAKGRLTPDIVEGMHAARAELRSAVRGALLGAGKLSAASPYLASGEWHMGVLRVRTDHSCGDASAEKTASALRAAGVEFAAFADLAEGGDQDGDGRHDWNGDGQVSPAARRVAGAAFAVKEDRGREAYVRDYSRTAADQGKPWVEENWALSRPGEFVIIRAVEVGPHVPAVCLGVPAGALPAGASDGYAMIDAAQSAGGVAAACELPGDVRDLPVELTGVVGIDAPPDAWDRMLATGRECLLLPGTALSARDLAGGSIPEKAGIVVVLSEAFTEEAILAALRRGSFYVTTAGGPRITGVEVNGGAVTVRTSEPCQTFFRGEGGVVLGGAFGTEASFEFTGREKYVRAVCLSDVLEDGFRVEAKTQAFYLSDDLPRSPVGRPREDWTIR